MSQPNLLDQIAIAAADVRQVQKQYFRFPQRSTLERCKVKEKHLDALLAQLELQKQRLHEPPAIPLPGFEHLVEPNAGSTEP
jgi:uncharacterized membrane protein (UPF0182 family)